MTHFHAVAFMDHQSVQVLRFNSTTVVEHKAHQHLHVTRQHGSAVRSEHEFFGAVCNMFDDTAEILVTGGRTGLADFRRYVEKHRPLTSPRIVGYEIVDHPSENQLIALARKHFAKYERMGGSSLGG